MSNTASYLRDLERFASPRGWGIRRTDGNHLRLNHPHIPQAVVASATPSDFRAIRNTIAQCKRLERQFGIAAPEPRRKRSGRPPIEDFGMKISDGGIVYVATCAGCGATEETTTKAGSIAVSMSEPAARFRKKGWHIKTRRSDDSCPDCANPAAPKFEPPPAAPITLVASEDNPPKVEIPREKPPSIERVNIDALHRQQLAWKRRAAAQLSKVYFEDIGYLPMESDATVAARVGCAKELVEVVRRDFYGSLKKATPMSALKREVSLYRRDVAAFERDVIDRIAKLEVRAVKILQWLDQIDDGALPERPEVAAEPELPLNGHDKSEAA